MKQKIILLIISCLCFLQNNYAQPFSTTDLSQKKLEEKKYSSTYSTNKINFSVKQNLIPYAFVAYGLGSISLNPLKSVNTNIAQWISPGKAVTSIDNILQYTPFASFYLLKLAGVKSADNYLRGTTIIALSNIIVTAVVTPTKHFTNQKRPYGGNLAFPSGHTAAAFAGAEFIHQEFKHKSQWYGIGAYAIASSVGVLRMVNNYHWFGDVVCGAGIGILSTKFAYWIDSKLHQKTKKELIKIN